MENWIILIKEFEAAGVLNRAEALVLLLSLQSGIQETDAYAGHKPISVIQSMLTKMYFADANIAAERELNREKN